MRPSYNYKLSPEVQAKEQDEESQDQEPPGKQEVHDLEHSTHKANESVCVCVCQ